MSVPNNTVPPNLVTLQNVLRLRAFHHIWYYSKFAVIAWIRYALDMVLAMYSHFDVLSTIAPNKDTKKTISSTSTMEQIDSNLNEVKAPTYADLNGEDVEPGLC
jgi:hypothetical protein